jgi:hypothetical protein
MLTQNFEISSPKALSHTNSDLNWEIKVLFNKFQRSVNLMALLFIAYPPEILYHRHLLRIHPYSTINMHGQFIIFALRCPSNSCMALHV